MKRKTRARTHVSVWVAKNDRFVDLPVSVPQEYQWQELSDDPATVACRQLLSGMDEQSEAGSGLNPFL